MFVFPWFLLAGCQQPIGPATSEAAPRADVDARRPRPKPSAGGGGPKTFAYTGDNGAPPSVTLSDTTVDGTDVDAAFAAVSAMRFEPYAGLLRGADGTERAASGNSWDQSLLLFTRLQKAGHTVRLMRGTLDEAGTDALIGTLTPESFAGKGKAAPTEDPALRKLVASHVWVEIQQAGAWVALDPTFPGAKSGTAATTGRAFNPTRSDWQQITVTLSHTVDGKSLPLGKATAQVALVAMQPSSLVVTSEPVFDGPPPKPAPNASVGGLGGGMGGGLGGFGGGLGGAPKPKPAPEPAASEKRTRIGTTYHRTFTFAGRPVKRSHTTKGETGVIEKEVLSFELTAPGQAPVKLERATWIRGVHGDTPPDFRRVDIGVFNRAVARSEAVTKLEGVDPEVWDDKATTWAAGKGDAKAVQAATKLAHDGGGQVGQALVHALASEADAWTARTADRFGVGVSYARPRVLLAMTDQRFEGDGITSTLRADLAHDVVHATPFSGAPEGASKAFQRARGIAESGLEGALVSTLLGGEARTTAALSAATPADRTWSILLKPEALDGIASLDPVDRGLMQASLANGHVLVAPDGPIPLHGEPDYGWWDVDLDSGAWVGVMHGGGHQAMAEYHLTLDVGMDDRNGFVLGMLSGSIATQTLLAASLLKYSAITDAIKKQIAATVARQACMMCPKGANVGFGAGGSVGTDCFTLWEAGFGETVGVSVPFCAQYIKGMKCAVTLMLDGIESQADIGAEASIGFTADIPYNCD